MKKFSMKIKADKLINLMNILPAVEGISKTETVAIFVDEIKKIAVAEKKLIAD